MSANAVSSADWAMEGALPALTGYAHLVPITSTTGDPRAPGPDARIRIAATGDIHLGRDGDADRWREAFDSLRGRVDLVLLAGDLTTHGEADQARMVTHAVAGLAGEVPILSVLGNHDWHVDRAGELTAI